MSASINTDPRNHETTGPITYPPYNPHHDSSVTIDGSKIEVVDESINTDPVSDDWRTIGSTRYPAFVKSAGKAVAKGRRKEFVTKIGNRIYSTHPEKEINHKYHQTVINLCCKHSKNGQICPWTGKFKNISKLKPKDDGYWNDENWIPLVHQKAIDHTCEGVPVGLNVPSTSAKTALESVRPFGEPDSFYISNERTYSHKAIWISKSLKVKEAFKESVKMGTTIRNHYLRVI